MRSQFIFLILLLFFAIMGHTISLQYAVPVATSYSDLNAIVLIKVPEADKANKNLNVLLDKFLEPAFKKNEIEITEKYLQPASQPQFRYGQFNLRFGNNHPLVVTMKRFASNYRYSNDMHALIVDYLTTIADAAVAQFDEETKPKTKAELSEKVMELRYQLAQQNETIEQHQAELKYLQDCMTQLQSESKGMLQRCLEGFGKMNISDL